MSFDQLPDEGKEAVREFVRVLARRQARLDAAAEPQERDHALLLPLAKPKESETMTDHNVGDDDPIPLTKACKIFFGGHLTKSGLRTEHRKGNLEIIRIANKDFVTRNGIKRMIERCTDKGPQQSETRVSVRSTQISPREAAKLVLRQRREKYDAEAKAKRALK